MQAASKYPYHCYSFAFLLDHQVKLAEQFMVVGRPGTGYSQTFVEGDTKLWIRHVLQGHEMLFQRSRSNHLHFPRYTAFLPSHPRNS